MIVCAFLLSCLDAGPEVDVVMCRFACACLSSVVSCLSVVSTVFLVSVSVCLSRCDCIQLYRPTATHMEYRIQNCTDFI